MESNFPLQCMYDGCEEEFDSHEDRLYHSMKIHRDINPKLYPKMTGASTKLLFDTGDNDDG